MILTDPRKSRGLLVDTNLLVPLTIGTLNISYVEENKRTAGHYTIEDFNLLLETIDQFQVLVVTPNILTEASNLLAGISYKGVDALSILMGIAIKMDETHRDSLSIMQNYSRSYTKFGLTDAVLHAMVTENYIVLTQDLRLCSYLEGLGLRVLNFNNFRTNNLLY